VSLLRRVLVAALVLVVLTSAATAVPAVAHDAPHRSPTAAAAAGRPYVLRLQYRVVPGDSPARIARRYGVSLSALLAANRLHTRSVIHPRQHLRIPDIVVPGRLMAKLPRALLRYPSRLRLVRLFEAAAREFGVPADLLMAVGYRESAWNPAALSRSGAIGVGQLMPTTVVDVSRRLLGLRRPLDPWVPRDNIRMSARLLRRLLHLTGGRTYRALAAYYQGFGSVTRQGVLPVGHRYARSVLALRPNFRA
jgi:soluble lytic murein transglycosylase-like protein